MALLVKEIFKKYRWEWAGFLVLIFVVLMNSFPDGYVIAGEDTFQHLNLRDHYRALFYEWHGSVSLFYGIFYLLERLHVSDTAQLSWYLGIFLLGSYMSFWGFCALTFGGIQKKIAVAGALFYALNLYTLYIFTYSWGYSHFQILYVFIPLLTGLYISFLRTGKMFWAALFLLCLFLASSGFANPAFSVSFAIFFLLITLGLILSGLVPFQRKTLNYLFFLGFCSFFVSAYWLLPVLPQVSRGVADLAATNSIDLGWWLQKTSNPISETLRLGQFNSGSFFPRNNPYADLDFLKPLILALSFLPILVVLVGLWRAPLSQRSDRRLFWTFFAVFVAFVALNARVRYPFDVMNNFLFHLPGLNTLRSYEKIAIFTPFLLCALFTLTLLRSWTPRFRKIILIATVVILLLPLPFYIGKLQQNLSFIMSQRSKDFRKSSHSFLIKIPQEYYDIQETLNTDTGQFKIASLPYNTDKIGWVSYPAWKMRGNDITAALYKAPLINPNTPYVGSWLFAQNFNESEEDPAWLVELLGLINTKYIIYHKDVHKEFLAQSIEKMNYLEASGALREVGDNEYFTLYRVKEEYLAPYLYLSHRDTSLHNYSLQGVLANAQKVRSTSKALDYQIIHPRKLVVSLVGNQKEQNLILNERYDTLWRAVYHHDSQRTILKRDSSVIHANAWRLDEITGEGTVVIEYLPMKLFFVGAWISGGVVLILIIYLFYYTYEQRRKKI